MSTPAHPFRPAHPFLPTFCRLVLAIGLLICADARAATFYVTNSDGDPTRPGTLAYELALANADTSGNTVLSFVAGLGTIYLNDSVTISRPMLWTGPGSDVTTWPLIAGNNSGEALIIIGATADQTELRNVIVGEFGGTGILVQPGATDCTFSDMRLQNFTGIGIDLSGAAAEVSGVLFQNYSGLGLMVDAGEVAVTDSAFLRLTGRGIFVTGNGPGTILTAVSVGLSNEIGNVGITLDPGANGCVLIECSTAMDSPDQTNATGLWIASNNNRVFLSQFWGGDTGVLVGGLPGQPWNGLYTSGNLLSNTGAVANDVLGTGIEFGPGAVANRVQGTYNYNEVYGFNEPTLNGDSVPNQLNASIGVRMASATNTGNIVSGMQIFSGYAGVLLSGNAAFNEISYNQICFGSLGGVVFGTSGEGGSSSNLVSANVIGLYSTPGPAFADAGPQSYGALVFAGSIANTFSYNIVGGQDFQGLAVFGYDCAYNGFSFNFIAQSNPGLPVSAQTYAAAIAGYGILFSQTWYNHISGNSFGPTGAGAVGDFGAFNTASP